MANMGIMHLLTSAPDSLRPQVACKMRTAHMALPYADFGNEPRQCKRCLASYRKREAKKAAKAAS